jgi:hypothetical protein
MEICNDDILEDFGRNRHYTWINQIFGDAEVQNIISNVYPEHAKIFKFKKESDPIDGDHHYIENKKNHKKICSVKNKIQNTNIDKYDTLCQSYSLLTFFEKNIHRNKYTRQMDMIELYKNEILTNNEFLLKFKEYIEEGLEEIVEEDMETEGGKGDKYGGKKRKRKMKMKMKIVGGGNYFPQWQIYYSRKNKDVSREMELNYDNIIENIHKVLKEWESYGFWYFIELGKCQDLTSYLEKYNNSPKVMLMGDKSGIRSRRSRRSNIKKSTRTNPKMSARLTRSIKNSTITVPRTRTRTRTRLSTTTIM